MVAPRRTKKVFCTVVRVPVAGDILRGRFSTRPSDLLPWADPYIARLVKGLQNEVRQERQGPRGSWPLDNSPMSELEPPSPCTDTDWEWTEEPRWSRSDEPSSDLIE